MPVGKVFAGLIDRPAVEVDAEIDQSADDAEEKPVDVAELIVRVGIGAVLFGDLLGVDPPAFDEGRRVFHAERVGRAGTLETHLDHVAGEQFVCHDARERPAWTAANVLEIDDIGAGAGWSRDFTIAAAAGGDLLCG